MSCLDRTLPALSVEGGGVYVLKQVQGWSSFDCGYFYLIFKIRWDSGQVLCRPITGIRDYRSRKAAVLGTQWDRSVGKTRTELCPVSLKCHLEQHASGACLGDQHAEGSSHGSS